MASIIDVWMEKGQRGSVFFLESEPLLIFPMLWLRILIAISKLSHVEGIVLDLNELRNERSFPFELDAGMGLSSV